jgi:GTP cyclohydrolase II
MASIRVTVPIKVGENSHIPAQLYSFDDLSDKQEHIAFQFEGAEKQAEQDEFIPLVRMHSECLTGDVFHSSRCDCGEQLAEAIEKVSAAGGVILYLRQEGRGIGLYPKIDAYALQDAGFDTYEANEKLGFEDDARNFLPAVEMLEAMGISKIRLLTNNPEKVELLKERGIEIVETVATGVYKKCDNLGYLKTKRDKKSHNLDI